MNRWWRALALVVAALLGGVLLTRGGGRDGALPPAAAAADRPPTAITSDAPRLAALEQLTAASDVVVRGEVVSVARGRRFGDPGAASIESRLVTIRIEEVLRGGADGPAAGSSLLVEEPGWLEDGTPVEVDGVPGATAGSEVIWFLQAVTPPALDRPDDAAGYVLVGPQGHYEVVGTRLRGPSGDDPLVARLEPLGPAGLAEAVRAIALARPSAP